MVSYAPLIENAAHGKDHLLVLKMIQSMAVRITMC